VHLHRQPVHERRPKAEQQVGGGACLSRGSCFCPFFMIRTDAVTEVPLRFC
jgi:hypothetical protein